MTPAGAARLPQRRHGHEHLQRHVAGSRLARARAAPRHQRRGRARWRCGSTTRGSPTCRSSAPSTSVRAPVGSAPDRRDADRPDLRRRVRRRRVRVGRLGPAARRRRAVGAGWRRPRRRRSAFSVQRRLDRVDRRRRRGAVTTCSATASSSASVERADDAFTDATALASTTYSYAVRARDAAGNVSAPSAGAPVTTPAAPPPVFADGFESGEPVGVDERAPV